MVAVKPINIVLADETGNMKLKSIQFDDQIDLTKIFKQPIPQKLLPKKSNQPVYKIEKPDVKLDVKLVGTVIMDKQKLVWLKVDNRVYQLGQGQTIPGVEAQISQIEPESVLISKSKNCTEPDQCHLVINIHESLF